MGKTTFQSKWLEDEKFKSWVAPVATSKFKACCLVCGTAPFDIGNMGQAAVTTHMKGGKHKQRMAARSSIGGISSFLTPPPAPTSSAATFSVATSPSTSTAPFVSGNAVLRAETLWSLNVVARNYSFHSSADFLEGGF